MFKRGLKGREDGGGEGETLEGPWWKDRWNGVEMKNRVLEHLLLAS